MNLKIKNLKFKIIFVGTPEFGAIILEGLIKANFKPVLVVTETDKPVGRKKIITPPPVKIIAEKYSIPIAQPEIIRNLELEIKNLKPDLGIVAAYGQILPNNILSIPKFGFLNVHPSLLPKYRGPSPIQHAILNGDKETGISIMLLDEKMDHGPIIAQRELEFSISNFQFKNLHDELAELGIKILMETIPKWLDKEIAAIPQDESQATYTKILTKDDGRIDWTKPAEFIERQVRAFSPWPGTFSFCSENQFGIKSIKILKAGIQEQTGMGPFGEPGKTYMATNEKIAVQAGKDFLVIEELQPESGKKMLARDFLMGHSDFTGTILK
jgi:methionyl-tRNA formyltransferase